MEQPLVSVQINCHNGDQFLHKAISSVYFQTYKNWEIIFGITHLMIKVPRLPNL